MTKDDIQQKVDAISEIYKSNREIPLMLGAIISCLFIVFFLFSNKIFHVKETTLNTELNKVMTLNNVDFSIIKRQYNPETSLVQVNFKMENKSLDKIRNYLFEVREKSNPEKIIDSNVIQIDDENYVLLVTVPKKWSVISITIKDESISDKSLKLYSDISDTEENSDLVELDKPEYRIELCQYDIENINDEIDQLKEKIDAKNEQISILQDNNNKLKDNEKYQIDSDKLEAEGTIITNENTINNLKNDISKLNKQIDDNYAKIEKLNEKIKDLE